MTPKKGSAIVAPDPAVPLASTSARRCSHAHPPRVSGDPRQRCHAAPQPVDPDRTCERGATMDSMTNDFGDVLLWSFWFFIWIAALMVWFRCLFDLFGDHTLSGWGKAGWALLLIFVPWLGALIYLIARGRSMTERQLDRAREMQAAQEQYIQQVAGTSTTPADQIANAKALLDSGTIDQSEFDKLKAKALA